MPVRIRIRMGMRIPSRTFNSNRSPYTARVSQMDQYRTQDMRGVSERDTTRAEDMVGNRKYIQWVAMRYAVLGIC